MILPGFIQSAINQGNTSLGLNKAFGDDYFSITNKLLNDRYTQVINGIEGKYGYLPTIDEAKTKLSKLMAITITEEKPLRNQLEKLCEATVNKTLGVPQETVLLDCKLVDKINPTMSLRIMQEEEGI